MFSVKHYTARRSVLLDVLLRVGLRTRERSLCASQTGTFPRSLIAVAYRQYYSLTVAGAVPGLCGLDIARTGFPFHRVAEEQQRNLQ